MSFVSADASSSSENISQLKIVLDGFAAIFAFFRQIEALFFKVLLFAIFNFEQVATLGTDFKFRDSVPAIFTVTVIPVRLSVVLQPIDGNIMITDFAYTDCNSFL